MILRVVMYVMANVFMALMLKSIQFQLIDPFPLLTPPYFRREQIWPEGEGGQLVGIVLIPRHGPKIPPRKSVHDAVQ